MSPQFAQHARQVGQRVLPAVALVRHIGLQQRERHRAAVVAEVFERAHHRHAVRERHLLGEEAADLEFGVDAGAQLAVALEEQRLADRDDRVAAHRAGPADGQGGDLVERERAAQGGRPELQATLRGGKGLVARHRAHHRAAELLVEEGIPHHPDVGLLAHLGQCRGCQRLHALLLALFPGERERHEVIRGLRRALDLQDRQQPAQAPGFPDGLVDQARARDGVALGRIPALRRDVRRQGIGLELVAQALRHADAPGHHAVAEQAGPAVEQHEHRPVLQRDAFLVPARHRHFGGKPEPVEAVRGQRQQVGQFADRRERGAAQHLDRHAPLEGREIELHRLRGAREIEDGQDHVVAVLADIGQDLAVARLEEGAPSAAEGAAGLAHGQHAARPVQQRALVAHLRLDIHRLVAVHRIHDRLQVEALRVGAREAGVAVGAPLHRRAHAVAVADEDVVAHADLVAVVHDRRARHRQQHAVHQLDAVHVVVHQRRQAPADAEVDARLQVGRIGGVHVVALAARHHLERELVVVAQEDRPLAAFGDVRRLLQDLDDRVAVLLRDRHVHARHQGKVIGHVALIALAEVLAHVLRPHVRLGQQEAVLVLGVDGRADLLDDDVRLREVLVARAVALHQVRYGVEPEAVDTHVEPEAHGLEHRLQHLRVVEVEVGLVAEEAVPEVLPGDRVPGPVRLLGVGEDDARALVDLVGVAPHVEVALRRAGRRVARGLEPRMVAGGVVDHQLGDHAQAARMRRVEHLLEVGQRAVLRMHVLVLRDVVAVVAQRRGVEGHQPDRVDAQVLHVVELGRDALEVADAVVVGIGKRLDVELVDHRVAVPGRVV